MSVANKLHTTMLLSKLLEVECELPPFLERKLNGIELDSRCIKQGNLFLAYKGASTDGRTFITSAIKNGAVAVLAEADYQYQNAQEIDSVPIIPIKDLALKISQVAARFYGYPARSMQMIGITGTNGKTTCSQLVAQSFSALGYQCGVIGTMGYGKVGQLLMQESNGPATTPDAIRTQEIFAELQAQHTDIVVMEVSSHGLQQHRVDVEDFSIAVFTNLTRDHLDYHGSMQTYGAAKLRLFSAPTLHKALINLDDPFSLVIMDSLAANVARVTWSISNTDADVYCTKLSLHSAGMELTVVTPWGTSTIKSALYGSFNASNLLAVLTTVLVSEENKPNFSFEKIVAVISTLSPVRGRMELIAGYPVAAVVDYAHTPDGLQNALQALREHCGGRICCVFGCGGNRDKGKRPLMGAIAEKLANLVVLTNDNPRYEDAVAIIADIQAGIRQTDAVVVRANRVEAISLAIGWAQEGDVVLIAGKGHESYQEIKDERFEFDDVDQVQFCLNQRFSVVAD